MGGSTGIFGKSEVAVMVAVVLLTRSGEWFNSVPSHHDSKYFNENLTARTALDHPRSITMLLDDLLSGLAP